MFFIVNLYKSNILRNGILIRLVADIKQFFLNRFLHYCDILFQLCEVFHLRPVMLITPADSKLLLLQFIDLPLIIFVRQSPVNIDSSEPFLLLLQMRNLLCYGREQGFKFFFPAFQRTDVLLDGFPQLVFVLKHINKPFFDFCSNRFAVKHRAVAFRATVKVVLFQFPVALENQLCAFVIHSIVKRALADTAEDTTGKYRLVSTPEFI